MTANRGTHGLKLTVALGRAARRAHLPRTPRTPRMPRAVRLVRAGLLLAGTCGAAFSLASCTRSPSSPPSPEPSSTSASAPAATDGRPSGQDGAIVFIENDYARALSEARAERVPLFVDAWASWCHTCLSMRSYVFPDAALRPLSRRFVWLALDTEREESASFVTRFDVHVLPTLFVLDPATESVRLAHPGSLTAVELARLLEPLESGGSPPAAADSPEVLAERVTKLADAKRLAECVTLGADEAPRMPPGTPLADVLRASLGCAADQRADAPERGRLPGLVALGVRVVSDPAQPILADDRSDLYDYVVDALRSLGRSDDANGLAHAWVAFLDDQAARASTPSARTVFDAHRLLADSAIGEPARAVPMLEASERDFPRDYNPPARLGKAYYDMKRYDDAIASLNRALSLAYGPRRLRFWSLEADAFVAKGDDSGARRALKAALDFAASTPLTGGYPALRDALARRLGGLEGLDGAAPNR